MFAVMTLPYGLEYKMKLQLDSAKLITTLGLVALPEKLRTIGLNPVLRVKGTPGTG